jgi:hypothetical protein
VVPIGGGATSQGELLLNIPTTVVMLFIKRMDAVMRQITVVEAITRISVVISIKITPQLLWRRFYGIGVETPFGRFIKYVIINLLRRGQQWSAR